MALYADRKGKFDEEYGRLWDELVPQAGCADTLQGELIRIIGRLASEYYRNGNMNWVLHDGYHNMAICLQNELCNYFEDDVKSISDDMNKIIQNGVEGLCNYIDDEDEYDRITDYVVIFCQNNKDAIKNDCPKKYGYNF